MATIRRGWGQTQVFEEMHACAQTSRYTALIAMLRIIQLAVGFTILFLTGYATFIFQGDFFHTFALTFTSFIWTLLLLIFIFVLPRWWLKWNIYWYYLMEFVTLIFWLSSFSLLIWECLSGDATFAVFQESGDPNLVTYVTASSVRLAIVGLKIATGLACMNWMAFVTTLIIAMKQKSG